ncbi:MAG: chorismate synthase [Bacillota bacterium]|nr:chorismate synthase [Bacillota bacterium]
MGSIWGEKLKISVFGESHGEAIGVVLDGFPAGMALDSGEIAAMMAKRAPGKAAFATSRKEEDLPEILSGLHNGITTGAPICAIIRNTSQRSADYSALLGKPRPGHADYTAGVKYNGYNDTRGGGHFSGRLSAPLLFAGAACMQALKKHGIAIGAHALEIAGVRDESFDPVKIDKKILKQIEKKEFPVLNDEAGEEMVARILAAEHAGDSVGGIVECAIVNIPAGIGEPMLHGLDSVIASIVFSIPAVKGVSFGAGFAAANLLGSQNNDAFYMDGSTVRTRTNHAGGVLGGISTGMPVIFHAAFKPTPSIRIKQETVDLIKRENCTIEIQGRHDPCIVPRAVPVVEGAAAVAVLDMMLQAGKY